MTAFTEGPLHVHQSNDTAEDRSQLHTASGHCLCGYQRPCTHSGLMMGRTGRHRHPLTHSPGLKTPIPDFLGLKEFLLQTASSVHTSDTTSHPQNLPRKKAHSLPIKAFKEFNLGAGRRCGLKAPFSQRPPHHPGQGKRRWTGRSTGKGKGFQISGSVSRSRRPDCSGVPLGGDVGGHGHVRGDSSYKGQLTLSAENKVS